MMRKYLSLMLVIMLAVCPLCAIAEGFSTNPDMIEKAALSVLKLKTFDAFGNPIATGSGFVIFDNITLVTNYHVMEDAFSMTAESDEGYEYYITGIKITDKEKDIAIMQFSAPTVMKPLDYSTEAIRRGERVAAIGSPIGLKNTFSTGNVSYVFTEDNVRWIQITAPISHGSSGGALFNETGKVIGITSATRSDGQNINFAVNISEAVDLYNAWKGTITKLGHQPNLAEELSRIGDVYYDGEGVIQDYKVAVKYYTEAADFGNSHAIYMLGKCYLNGDGVDQNDQKAVEYFTHASQIGNSEAIVSLGQCYLYGYGVSQDEYKARDLFQQAADLQNSDAMLQLGVSYLFPSNPSIQGDEKEAFSWINKAAMLDNVNALVFLGGFYAEGLGVSKNSNTAFELFSKAADLGSDGGMQLLGICYQEGIGTNINHDKMTEWYTKAADLGNSAAMISLAYCSYRGESNNRMAYDLALKAAELNNAEAMCFIGICYENGIGVEKNKKSAKEWYQKALDAGNQNAQQYLNNLQSGVQNTW